MILRVFWILGIQHTHFSEYNLFHFLSFFCFVFDAAGAQVVDGNRDSFFFGRTSFWWMIILRDKASMRLSFRLLILNDIFNFKV